MPSRWTFKILPIAKLLEEEVTSGIWLDPFSGQSEIAQINNDVSPATKAESHMDALEFLKQQAAESVDGVLYDPPYSITQAVRRYGIKEAQSKSYWSNIRKEIGRIIKPGGKAISFGWNSGGIGKKNGFLPTRILLVPHGGGRNDTIVTVEHKVSPNTPNNGKE